jgi:hypothetical protein
VGDEGKLHDSFGANGAIEYATQDHGNRKTYKPHLVDKAELLGIEVKCFSQLRQDTRPDAEGKCRSDQRKAAPVKKSLWIVIHWVRVLGFDSGK